MRIETVKVGSRVELVVYGSESSEVLKGGRIGAYDDPVPAVEQARKFLDDALAAAHHSGQVVLAQQELMEREHAAWLDIGQEFAAKGIDINEGGWSSLIYAIRKWGEELVQLRVGDPRHTEKALREAREGYEGQYERGTYPEAIDRG